MTEDYTPTTEDIDWAKAMITILKSGGILTMPGCGNIYQIDKEDKTLTLLFMVELAPDAVTTHRRTQIVFKAIGYEVIG